MHSRTPPPPGRGRLPSTCAPWPAWVTVACLLLCASPGATQTTSTSTGVITGTVTDATGGVLTGAAVTLTSPALMGARTTRTTNAGSFRFAALPPGTYTLALAAEGFTPAERVSLYVAAGFTATVDVTMHLREVADEVLVERLAPVVDRHATSLATTFDARQLTDLPGSRTMGSILAATPAVYVSRFDVGGSSADTGVYGAYGTSGFNRPMVEGLSVTGIVPTGFALDFGSFEEVSVGTGAHGPEWHSAGVQMQFISRSGGNRYRGTFYAGYEDRDWQSSNVDDEQVRLGAGSSGGLAPDETNRLWSYYDVNADVGGYVRPDTLWWYFSFRDQETAARQVNFTAAPLRTHVTNYTGKATYRPVAGHTLIGYVQAGRNLQPFRLDPFGPAGGPLSAASAIHASEESTSRQHSWGWIGKLEWNAAVGDLTFVELRGGQFGADRSQTPNGSAPRFEDVVTLAVQGGDRDWQNAYRRHQVLGSVSHFKDGWLGAHHFKAGGEIFLTTETETWRQGYPDDVLHVLRASEPVEVYLFETPSQSESGLWTYSAYVHDSWRPHRRVTLNLGARLDRYRVFLPAQVHPAGRFNPTPQTFATVDEVIAWNLLVPRTGVSYDLTGDGRTVVKAGYGRYTLAPGSVVGFNANPNSNQWWRRYLWADADGSGLWEAGEEGRLLGSRGGVALESLDAGLELPMVTEAAAWFERELPWGIGLRTGVVWRSTSQLFMRSSANRPFTAFTVPVSIADPGTDGRVGTVDDGPAIQGWDLPRSIAELPPVNVVRNVAGAEGRHWTWEISAQRRYSGRWSLLASFAHVWNGDQANIYFGQAVRQNPYPVTPNDLMNAGPDGRYDFTTWTAKVSGTFDGPWDLRVAPLLRHQSGQPFGRTFAARLESGTVRVLAEPMGTRRMDHVTLIDLRVEKGFRVPGERRAAAFIDVYNLLNANPAQNINWSSGSTFLRPLAIVPPRIVRLGARLDW